MRKDPLQSNLYASCTRYLRISITRNLLQNELLLTSSPLMSGSLVLKLSERVVLKTVMSNAPFFLVNKMSVNFLLLSTLIDFALLR